MIPAILYGENSNENISVVKKQFQNILDSEFLSSVLEIEINGKKKVLPREVSYHVVSDEPIHIDFMRIVSGTKIILEIPVRFINQSESPDKRWCTKHCEKKIELNCPADNIPKEIVIDLSGTDIGTSIKWQLNYRKM